VWHARFATDDQVVTASDDGKASLWDATTGNQLATFASPDGVPLVGAVPSPDGRRVLTVSAAGTVMLWDRDGTGRHLHDVGKDARPEQYATTPAAFSPDGAHVAAGAPDGTLRIWDTTTGTELGARTLHHKLINVVAFSPDGTRVVTASDDNTARVWNAATVQPITVIHHSAQVVDATFSPDSRRVATASNDRTAKVSDGTTGDTQLVLSGHDAGVNAVRFNVDGTQLATAADDATVNLWEATTGRRESRLVGHSASITSLVYAPDGKQLVTTSLDETATMWSATPQQQALRLVGHDGQVFSAELSRDGTRAITSGVDATARIWDAASGKPVLVIPHPGVIGKSALSADGTHLATADETGIRVWSATTGTIEHTLPVAGGVWDLAWGPRDASLLAGCDDHLARIYTMPAGTLIGTFTGHADRVENAVFSPDGEQVITTSPDRTTRVWRTQTRELIRSWSGSAYNASLDPRGRRVVARDGLTARIWAFDDPDQHLLAQMTHEGTILDVEWSSHGDFLVTASLDATVRVWDADGNLLDKLGDGHTQWYRARFSADDRRIIGASSNGVMIWDLPPTPPSFEALARCKRLELRNDGSLVMAHRPEDCT
jgi:WD40 repeat protein